MEEIKLKFNKKEPCEDAILWSAGDDAILIRFIAVDRVVKSIILYKGRHHLVSMHEYEVFE